MDTRKLIKSALRTLAVGAAAGVAAYGSYVGITWYRYGRKSRPPSVDQADALLDRFLPTYEVVERHRITVSAPAEIVLAAAGDYALDSSTVVRAIFKTRELVLGNEPSPAMKRRGLLAQTKALGWGVLAEIPGREIVMGAVTRPWEPPVVFRAVPDDEFAAFDEPCYVKIAWTLRADPMGPGESVFRTETRVATTDPEARRKFRRYWAFFSPGIILIRWMMLGQVRREAARRRMTP